MAKQALGRIDIKRYPEEPVSKEDLDGADGGGGGTTSGNGTDGGGSGSKGLHEQSWFRPALLAVVTLLFVLACWFFSRP